MTDNSETLRVDLGDRSYDIVIGGGLTAPGSAMGAEIAAIAGTRQCWIVTDDTVAPLHLDRCKTLLSGAGVSAETIILPSGEASKCFASVEQVVSTVLDGAPERASTLIALGGGVIGDITGFAASMVLRGISFVQIPTTLLAQVDSSVGGKTGINTAHGKNLVGAFYQPRLVIADTDLLATLPRREMLAGYAEVVKYGLIRAAGFFDWLEANGRAVIDGDAAAQRHAIRESCAIKAEIVAEDEREDDVRALLNFGHTFGHALEAETGYGAELLHGEAVAIGMLMALELSEALDLCPADAVRRVRTHYGDTGLPAQLPAVQGRAWAAAPLLDHMRQDKKVRDGQIAFILARGIGDAFVARDVSPDDVLQVLERATAA